MANRTMLIAANKVPMDQSDAGLKTIGLSEFNYDIPLIYSVLVSVKPRLCQSVVFEMDEPLAIAGDAKGGLRKLQKLRSQIGADAPNGELIDQVIEFLSKAHHDYPYFLLEPAEVFSMSGDPLGPQMKGLLKDVKKLNMRAVKKRAAGELNYQDWAADCWTNVLYFVPRGAVEPPIEFDRRYLSLTTQQIVENADAILNLTGLENLSLETDIGDENLDPALQLLARVKPAFHLNISGQAHELPVSLGGLTGISGLSIHSLGLKTLPIALQDLTQLKKLVVSRNDLTEIPEFLRSMSSQFDGLNFSENLITKLPDWISEFENLEQLNVMGNPISALPDSLWEMQNLKQLYIGNTKLTALPEAIEGLTSLTGFNAEGLGLTGLPDGFWTLKNLAGFTLQNNPLGPTLPEDGLRSLTKLKNVNFLGCGIEVFPEALCELPELVRMDFRKNKISTVPKCMREKPLDWIGLQGNPHGYTRADFNAKAIGL